MRCLLGFIWFCPYLRSLPKRRTLETLGHPGWLVNLSYKTGTTLPTTKATVRNKFYSAAKHLGHGVADGMRSINVNYYYCYQYYILVVKAKRKHAILSCRFLVIQKVTKTLLCSR